MKEILSGCKGQGVRPIKVMYPWLESR